jgi:hypothetical protein
MTPPSPEKLAEWQYLAKQKNAIVPEFFEVFPNRVKLVCGRCKCIFVRNLIYGRDEPTFTCPQENCAAKNWVPVRYPKKKFS